MIARAEAVQSDQWPKSKLIPHMIDVGGKLVEAQPPKHPTLKIRMKLDVQTYKDLKIPLQLRKSLMSRSGKVVQTPHVELLCDTGAQVDSIGRKKLKLLGLEEDQLLRPQVLLDCANKTAAEVIGVFFGEVSAMEGDWQADKVKVLFYVMKQGGDKLSRHTCERLGIIDEEFPKPGCVKKEGNVDQAEV